jgi:hypothetical protein
MKLAVIVLMLSAFAAAQEIPTVASTEKDRTGVALTVYNTDRALVTETRNAAFPAGLFRLNFADVPSAILPETVAIKALRGGSLQVLEQNYEYDLISPQKLLQKYLNRDVTLVQLVQDQNSTAQKRQTGKLLAVNDGTVWRIGDTIVTNPSYAWLEFPQVPDNLYARPTLVWLGQSKGGDSAVEASYMTRGLRWTCDYVLTLSQNEKSADLIGWVTLVNTSGTAYRDASLKLIAGDVNLVQPPLPKREMDGRSVMMAAAAPQFQEKSFFEYHLYTLQRRATVADAQQKQIELLHGEGVAPVKEYVLEGQSWYYRQKYTSDTQKVAVLLRTENTEKNHLGVPLPKGTVRVYQRDSDGSLQFIGEDTIDHTPRDESFSLSMGNAFDIAAERKQADFTVLGNCANESEYEITLRNHKAEDVVVKVVEPLGGDWTMVKSSHPFEKTSSSSAEFHLAVPKNGKTILTYRVRTRSC